MILIQIKENIINSFEKDFFKLVNNSAFGKTMENLRKIINVILVSNAGNYKKYVSKQVLFGRRYLVKILLLFMKSNQL